MYNMIIMIDCALLSEEEFSKMKLLNAFIQKFTREVVLNQNVHFDPSISDLESIYSISNEVIFKNKLQPMPAFQFKVISSGSKGSFGWQDIDDNGNVSLKAIPVLGYFKQDNDSFLNVAAVILHEMIHYLDLIEGPLSLIKASEIKVTQNNNSQYIGDYDVHGHFFEKWSNIIYENGIQVPKTFLEKGGEKYLMVDDNGAFIKDDGTVYEAKKVNNQLGEVNESDSLIVKYAKRMFGHLRSDGAISVSVKGNTASFVID